MNVFEPITELFTGNKSPQRKRSYRWKTVLNGRVLHRHYTKKAAESRARSIRGARVLAINEPIRTRTRTTRKRRRVRTFRR